MLDIKHLKDQHQKFVFRQDQILDSVLDDAGKAAQQHVTTKARFQRRGPSSMKDTTETRVIRRRGKKTLIVRSPKQYASFIDQGTAPYLGAGGGMGYTIRPRRANALRFRVGGEFVFAKQVTHPGIKPRKFLWLATLHAFRYTGQNSNIRLAQLASKFGRL